MGEVTESRNIWRMERSVGDRNIKNMKSAAVVEMQVQRLCCKEIKENTSGNKKQFAGFQGYSYGKQLLFGLWF